MSSFNGTTFICFICLITTLEAVVTTYWLEDVSTLTETTQLPSNAGLYNKYVGEFYYGPLFGDVDKNFVKYLIHSPDGYESRYMLLNDSLPADPSLLNWASDSVLVDASNLIKRRHFVNGRYLVIRMDSGSEVVYNGVVMTPVKFRVSFDSCLNELIPLNITTKLKGLSIPDGIASKLIIVGYDCGQMMLTSLSPSVIINKTKCGMDYDIDISFVIITGPIVNSDNSQHFNLVCSHNLNNVTVDTGNITDVEATISEQQTLTEFVIHPTMNFVNPLNNDRIIGEAFVGENVRLLIQIPDEQYRTLFDLKIVECLLDGEYILRDGLSVTPLIPNPSKDEQGVIYMDFPLFKVAGFDDSHRLTVQCTVETCVDACDNILSNKRRKRHIVKRKASWITSWANWQWWLQYFDKKRLTEEVKTSINRRPLYIPISS